MTGLPPCVLDGTAARLNPGAGRSLATGPGQLGPDGAPATIIWHAAIGMVDLDLLGSFWRHEVDHIDWLTGYNCDSELATMFELLAAPELEEEEIEEMYSKESMSTLGSGMEDEY